MADLEVTDPSHLTVDYVGQPGERTFYLQAHDEFSRVDVLIEKVQAAALADLLAELLARIDDVPATDWDEDAMALREPVQPRWRAGEMAVGLDPERGRFVLDLTQFDPEAEDPDGLEVVRIWINQDQARRLAAHTAARVGEGRPPGETEVVKDVTGKVVFPSTNGHGRIH